MFGRGNDNWFSTKESVADKNLKEDIKIEDKDIASPQMKSPADDVELKNIDAIREAKTELEIIEADLAELEKAEYDSGSPVSAEIELDPDIKLTEEAAAMSPRGTNIDESGYSDIKQSIGGSGK